MSQESNFVAFSSDQLVHKGPLTEVLSAVKLRGTDAGVLIFDSTTGQQVDFDMRGSLDEVLDRVRDKGQSNRVGRPKLGVESREVSLLPKHWEWLQNQSGGASVTLRKLIEREMRTVSPEDQIRRQREATYKTMSALAGNRTNFEEASRALFAGNHQKFGQLISSWPRDIKQHLKQMIATNV